MEPEKEGRSKAKKNMSDSQFRFQDFKIWKKGAALSGPLFGVSPESKVLAAGPVL